MSTKVNHVQVPGNRLAVLGQPDPGTRAYHRYGRADEFAAWLDAVCEVSGPDGVVSPGGAGAYARVTRAGVHKRLREGRLTAFVFHVTEDTESVSAAQAPPSGGRSFTYIPLQECRSWAERLRVRRGEVPPADERPVVSARAAEQDDSWRQW
jgi:hypothetical protein